jgi:L-ascorbate metabolism protein UlaG (beta-lactamase superfamily)
MDQKRREFLKYALGGAGVALGFSAYWLGASQRRAARLVRMLVADTRRRIMPAPVRPDPNAWSDNAITICWIGHATMLINFHGIRILTDPAFGDRIGVSLGLGTAGPKRYVAPALQLQELPPIDVVVLSHAHMDHMDVPSLRRLLANTFTVAAKDTSDILAGARVKEMTELRWGEKTRFQCAKGDLDVSSSFRGMPANLR